MDSNTHTKRKKAGKRTRKRMCERDVVILNKVVSKVLTEGGILRPKGSKEGDIWISGRTCYHFRPSEIAWTTG